MHSTKKRLVFSLLIITIILIASSPIIPIWIISFSNIVNVVPKQKFYWLEPFRINGIKVWELKNLQSSKSSSLTMFYMAEKSPEKKEEIIDFCKELIEKQQPVIQTRIKEHEDKDTAQVEIYLETKSMPKYYKETFGNKWAVKDLINDHFDAQIAMVFLNSSLEITYIWVTYVSHASHE